MGENFDDEPRKKKKGKTIFTKKRLALLLGMLLLIWTGAVIQHYVIEPILGEGIAAEYTKCMGQKQVLDQRFIDCSQQLQDANNHWNACEFQLGQCLQT